MDNPQTSSPEALSHRYVRNMDLRVLGPLEAVEDGQLLPLGGMKQRTVLALLIAHGGRPVSTDALIDGVYGEEPPSGARRSVQTYVSNLRRQLGDVISSTGSGYVLDADRSSVDATRFESLVSEADNSEDPAVVGECLREALAMWRGHPFGDVDGFGAIPSEISRLSELRMVAVERRVDADLQAGRHAEVVGELEALTTEYPFRERFHGQHMLALYRAGRQAESVRAFEKARVYLVEQMGLDPSPELRALEQQILQQDPGLGYKPRPTIRRAAVLVADVDDPAALGDTDPGSRIVIVDRHTDLVTRAIEDHAGVVFAQRGTAIYSWFDSAGEAAAAAEEAQWALADIDESALRLRVAIDLGDVEVVGGGSIQGPPVSRAAALVASARGGYVLLAASAQSELASGGGHWQIRGLGTPEIDGIAGDVAVYSLQGAWHSRGDDPLRETAILPAPPERGHGIPGYEWRERVGAGAFGVVHRAYQPAVGREVAIKKIRAELADHPSFIRRFEVEAQLVARLEHPHIVPLYDFWRDADGAFLVMRWMGGGSLRDRLGDGPLGLADTSRLLSQIGPALATAHRKGVVHRDLRAENILRDEEGNWYLSDFGVAYVDAPDDGQFADLTDLGSLLGDCVGDASGAPAVGALVERAASGGYTDVATLLEAWDRSAGGVETALIAPLTEARNPYKGLDAFGELDAADFHGRDALVGQLVATVGERSLVGVVGPSGIGKSSVVRAGLLPAVRHSALFGSGEWLVTDMVPTAYPFEQLASALERVATRAPADLEERLRKDRRGLLRAMQRHLPQGSTLLLVIDQFEELFTLVTDEETRTAFLDVLAETATDVHSPVRIVLTIRADFFDRPLRYAEFGQLLRSGTIPASAPTEEELREIIVNPAAGVGVGFEPGLVDRIVADVEGQPGTLPLLEFALTRLFDHRSTDAMSSGDYDRVGGVLAALGRRAEQVYTSLDDLGHDVARQVFMRLVNVNESGRPTRRRTRLTELARLGFSQTELQAVIAPLVEARLLTLDRDPVTRGPTVEVAHEALLAEWPRLTEWIEGQQEDLLLHSRLASAVTDWEDSYKSENYLLRAGRLEQHEAWTAGTELSLTSVESEFLEVSRTIDDERRAQRRRVRRRVMAGFGIAAVLASVLAVTALVARSEAQDQANTAAERSLIAQQNEDLAVQNAAEAEVQRQAAESAGEDARLQASIAQARELAASAIANLDRDPELSLLLALQSASVADALPETISAVREALSLHRAVYTYEFTAEDYAPTSIGDLSPDGRLLSAHNGFGSFEVVDVASGRVLWGHDFPGGKNILAQGVFINDGTEYVVGAMALTEEASQEDSAGLFVFDAQTGEPVRSTSVGPCGPYQLGFWHFTDTHAVVSVNECGFEGGSGVPLYWLDLRTGEYSTLLPEGSFRATMNEDETLLAWGGASVTSLETGEIVFETPGTGQVAALSPDGRLLVVLAESLQVWDIASRQKVSEYHGHARVWNAWFSPDGSTVYSTGPDGVVHLWDPLSGRPLLKAPYGDSLWMSRMTADGLTLATWTLGGRSAKVFDLRPGATAPGRTVSPPAEWCEQPFYPSWNLDQAEGIVAIYVGCRTSPSPEGRVQLVDIQTGEVIQVLSEANGQSIRFSPDGSIVAAQRFFDGAYGNVTLWDTVSGLVVNELTGLCPYGDEIAPECQEFPNEPFYGFLHDLDYSPDGTRIAAAVDEHNAVLVWDLASLGLIDVREVSGGKLHGVEFNADGSWLAIGNQAGIQLVNMVSGQVVERAFEDGSPGGDMAFTKDGLYLVAAAPAFWGAPDVYVLDAGSLETQSVIREAHDGGIRSLAVSDDGARIGTAGLDGFVRLWDRATGSMIAEWPLGSDASNVAFMGDGDELLATFDEGPAVFLSLDVDELLKLAASRLTRGLTGEECAEHRIDPCPTLDEIRSGI